MLRLLPLSILPLSVVLSLTCCAEPSGGGDRPLGQTCDADEDCADGLACVDGGELSDEDGAPVCSTARFCTQSCASDDECAELADGTICVDACDIVDAADREGVGGPVCFEGSRG